jgi:hypothetical protein
MISVNIQLAIVDIKAFLALHKLSFEYHVLCKLDCDIIKTE